MSVLHGERAVIREAYKTLDEALEFANSELNKADENYGHRIAREYLETGSVQGIEDNLKKPPPELYQRSPQLATEVAILLSNCYDLTTIIKEVWNQVERVVELARQDQIDYNSPSEEGAMRQPPHDRNRPEASQGTRKRPRTLSSNDTPSNVTVGDFGAGHVRQETNHPEPN